jgi:hypothetical protein
LGNILRIAGFKKVRFEYVLLEIVEIGDKKHMVYDKTLFKALPRFMHRVTGRNIVAYAKKLPSLANAHRQIRATFKKAEMRCNPWN